MADWFVLDFAAEYLDECWSELNRRFLFSASAIPTEITTRP
jgi:hypothetical protein